MNMIKNLCALTLGLSLVLVLSLSVYAQSGRGSISGLVCSRVGNDPLANARIELHAIETISSRTDQDRSTIADENGRYEMLQVTMGEYWLTISAEGYEAYKTKVFIPSDGHLVWATVLRKIKS